MSDHQAGAAERITAAVQSWPEVKAGPHRFGGVEFRLLAGGSSGICTATG